MSFKQQRGNISSNSFTRMIHQRSVVELQDLDSPGEEDSSLYSAHNRRAKRGSGAGMFHQVNIYLQTSLLTLHVSALRCRTAGLQRFITWLGALADCKKRES